MCTAVAKHVCLHEYLKMARHHHTPRYWLWLGISLLVVLLDQLTKVLIIDKLALGDGFAVTSFFNIVRVHNPGAAFSFLAAEGGWQRWFFTVLGLVAASVIVWMLRNHAGQKLFAFALSMILGGAVGNVIDRLIHSYVIDFLDFHYAGMHYPSFNLADCAITLGAICLILDEVIRVRRGR
jgi:signal peptidase II